MIEKSIETLPVNRRKFLLTQLQTALALALGPSVIWSARKVMAAGLPDIAVAEGGPAAATRAAVNLLGGMGAFVRPGQKVVIKPNMSFDSRGESASNTHPEVVRELVAMCQEAGAGRVRVLDHTLRSKEQCIEGVKTACSVFDGDIVQGLDRERFFRPTPIPQGETFKQTDVMGDVLDSDVLIAAPVAKSHGSTGVSLSMKGMMGLIYDRGIMHYRYDLSPAIVDLATVLKPQLVVVDASRVLTTNGPAGPGKVIEPGQVIASRDMVAADAQVVASFPWYGRRMQPRQVKHIRLAHERRLGRMDIENLIIRRVKA
ncbi:MAG: DUF362 domain-containing protein [Desulfobacterales bacterium]|nr:DUF362 domain-containing protein [Desulfobacterales bacterium]